MMTRPNKEDYVPISVHSVGKYEKDLEAYCDYLEERIEKMKWIKKLPCKCGYDGRRERIRKNFFWGIRCPKCGLEVVDYKNVLHFSERNLNKLWNEVVSNE